MAKSVLMHTLSVLFEVLRPASTSSSATTITLAWDTPCDRGALLTGYRIQYARTPDLLDGVEEVRVEDGKVREVTESARAHSYSVHRVG